MGVWSTMRSRWQGESAASAPERLQLQPLPVMAVPYLDVEALTLDDWFDADDPVLANAVRALDAGRPFAQAATAFDETRLALSAQRVEAAALARGWSVERLMPAGRWRDPLDVEVAMAGLSDAPAEGRRRLWLIPEVHRAFVRAPGTAAAITCFLERLLAMRGTDGLAVWVGCRPHAWRRLAQWRGADAVIDDVNAVEEAPSMDIAKCFWTLHQRSERALKVSSKEDGRGAVTVDADNLRPLSEWVKATRGHCGGHLALLAEIARQSTGLDDEGAVVLCAATAPRIGTLGTLTYPQRYLLMEVLVHGHLQLAEMAEIFVCPEDRVAADAAVLRGWHLLELDDGGYRVPPQRTAWIARRLSALQTLE